MRNTTTILILVTSISILLNCGKVQEDSSPNIPSNETPLPHEIPKDKETKPMSTDPETSKDEESPVPAVKMSELNVITDLKFDTESKLVEQGKNGFRLFDLEFMEIGGNEAILYKEERPKIYDVAFASFAAGFQVGGSLGEYLDKGYRIDVLTSDRTGFRISMSREHGLTTYPKWQVRMGFADGNTGLQSALEVYANEGFRPLGFRYEGKRTFFIVQKAPESKLKYKIQLKEYGFLSRICGSPTARVDFQVCDTA